MSPRQKVVKKFIKNSFNNIFGNLAHNQNKLAKKFTKFRDGFGSVEYATMVCNVALKLRRTIKYKKCPVEVKVPKKTAVTVKLTARSVDKTAVAVSRKTVTVKKTAMKVSKTTVTGKKTGVTASKTQC